MANKRKRRKSNSNFFEKYTSKICIGLSVFIAVVLLFFVFTVVRTLSYDRVFDGIYVNEVSVSHMTREELQEYIDERFGKPLGEITIDVHAGQNKWQLNAKELEIQFDKEAIVDSIYNVGRGGNVFKRLSDINLVKSENLYLNPFADAENKLVTYNETAIEQLADKIVKDAAAEVVQHQVRIEGDSVSIVAGTNGYTFEKTAVKNAILESINRLESNSLDITQAATVVKPNNIDVESYISQINKAPVNASFSKNGNKELVVSPSEYGFSVDRAALEAVAAKLEENPGKSFEVAVTKIKPEINASDLKIDQFNEVLGEASTNYSTGSSNANRNTNLEIATNFLNGIILLPGEQFSFNQLLGDTTAAKGYKPAAGYSAQGVVPTYGGGVCQVSTTLYNAVINSVALSVKERWNHSYTVDYVPRGLDCMINYNTNDFKFVNNSKYPIKIVGTCSKGKLSYKITGVNENKTITYKFESKTISTTPFTTSITTDPAKKQGGKNGGRYSVTRVTYQNGVEIKREDNWTTSNYKPLVRIVYEAPVVDQPVPDPEPPPDPSEIVSE